MRLSGNADADNLLNDLQHHPHAFFIGALVDRQIVATRAWMIPYELSLRLGGFEFDRLAEVDEACWRDAMRRPSPLHRFCDAVASDIHSAIARIGMRYGGRASRIWDDTPSSAEVVFRFLEFRGIGPKIATMAANILARDFKVPMSDHYSIDVSVDVHVRRVFTRLRLVDKDCSTEEIVYRARALSPQYPGLLDYACWDVGKQWCRPKEPLCGQCILQQLCPTAQAKRGTE